MNFNEDACKVMQAATYKPIPVIRIPTKHLLKMKLTVFFVLSFGLFASASVFSQEVSLRVRNASLAHVINEIRNSSGYTFIYDAEYLQQASPISIELKNTPIAEALEKIFKNQPFTYIVKNETIILTPSKSGQQEPAVVVQLTISGKVTAKSGEALGGVSVLEKGTSNGTSTKADGSFTLTLQGQHPVLIFQYMGYKRQEQSAGQSFLNITLEEDLALLEEVMVSVGYSKVKEEELTSAVTTIKAEKLRDVTANNVGTMLQGKVAGLQVVNSSGQPGASPEIRLRGVSSINASQSPLVVVDGIIGGNYDPNDVESITILKDAGATAMYGSQANAGVMIITTKQAFDNKNIFEFRATSGVKTADFGTMKMMDGAMLYEHHKNLYRDYIVGEPNNSYKIDLLKFYSERPLSLRDQNYNWTGELFSASPTTNIYFSVRGKTEKNSYYAAASYYDEKGTFLNTQYKRLNLRANSTYRFSEKIHVRNNLNISGSIGNSYDYMDMYYAFLNLPWDNPYDENGQALYVDGNVPFRWWSRDKVNPVHTIKNSDHPYKGFDANYDFTFEYQIVPWLSFSSATRVSAGYNKATNYFSPLVAGAYNGTGYLEESNSLFYGGISNNLLRFNFDLQQHHINGLAGVAFEGGRNEYSGGSGRGLPEGLRVLNVVSNNQMVNGYFDRSAMQSLISQVNYNYAGKYFLTASFRVDGSSAFPPGNQYASFPAISGAWYASKESFLSAIDWLDNLKIRASYGVTGTQDIGASRFLGLFSLASQYNSSVGAIPYQLANPNLTWESKHQYNVGIDLGIFSRLNLTVDAYKNITKDLLLQVSQPLSAGFEVKWDNAGRVNNEGIELGINSKNIHRENFEWSTDLTISFNRNKLSRLPADIVRTTSRSVSQIYRNGGNLYEFYMPKWGGVDPATGAALWEKLIEDSEGRVIAREMTPNYAEATQQEVGSALPRYQGGFNNSLRYRRINLQVSTAFSQGNKVFSNDLRYVFNDGNEPYYNQVQRPKGTLIWAKPGDIATEPSPQHAANASEPSSRFLKNGSFFRIRNISLSYSLPEKFVKERLKMADVTIGLSADNVYTFTDFLGQDPQTTIISESWTMPGVADFKYPNNRQFLFNISCRF
ncbi:SusC/RagA family TonB-linked outer membrane protein [Olivibacter sp. CPCC 100613]|uniref:SusC/RagA family TonB-linked outer membrane protein n=1 Tax=Olivibacter sp. CPCC 100613 TaxID=3079931 RepID=UPI002FFAC960